MAGVLVCDVSTDDRLFKNKWGAWSLMDKKGYEVYDKRARYDSEYSPYDHPKLNSYNAEDEADVLGNIYKRDKKETRQRLSRLRPLAWGKRSLRRETID